MNKTNLAITGVLFLLIVTLAVTVPPVIHAVAVAGDLLQVIGLVTTCFGVAKAVEAVKNKLGKK